MDLVDIILAILYFALIGWVVHQIMGKSNHGGGFLHYMFVGGCGSGIGALLEWATGHYSKTLLGAIGLCLLCAGITEYAIRQLQKSWTKNESMMQTLKPLRTSAVIQMTGNSTNNFGGELFPAFSFLWNSVPFRGRYELSS